MKTYIIKEDVANAILQYLVKQPYEQVFQMVQMLQQLEPKDELAKIIDKKI